MLYRTRRTELPKWRKLAVETSRKSLFMVRLLAVLALEDVESHMISLSLTSVIAFPLFRLPEAGKKTAPAASMMAHCSYV